MKKLLIVLICLSQNVLGQVDSAQQSSATIKTHTPAKAKWYDNISIRGYMQVRYNRLLETNPSLKCEQCDRSWGENGGLFIRRMRIIIYGQIHERVYFYIQPDLASAPSTNAQNFAQIRDAYVDLGIDKKSEYRIRLGQSKIPFGFENLQSSQNRIPLDRNDALNSAISNERDVAAFFYWAPSKKRKLLSSLVSEGFKGSGDYGILGLGVFNGQTANRPELNNSLHKVARLTYPVEIGKQVIETSLQAYTGKYVIPTDQISAGTKVKFDKNYRDERIAGSFVLYPKPFGIQAEYNIGRGPEFNTASDSIELKKLSGGYATFSYMMKIKEQIIFPFIRMQTYSGGKKHELDARSYDVDEYEIGVEWQPIKNFELVTMYTYSKRRFEDLRNKNNLQKGSLLRLQAQLNF